MPTKFQATKSRRAASGMSRRTLLRGAAQLGVALPLAHALPAAAAAVQGTGKPSAAPLPRFNWSAPVFTVAERDRRWAAVRANMAKPSWNLDAIITAVSDPAGANARFLSQVAFIRNSGGSPQVLFPRDPARTVIVQASAARHAEEWTDRLKPGGWLADGKMKLLPETESAAMAKLLVAEGFNKPGTRIGVAKLKGTRFDPDGIVSATFLDTLKSALPGVVFVPIEKWGDDAGPIDQVMLVKSKEEQDAIRRAVAVNEQALAAMVAAIRGGAARQADLWWAAFATMLAGNGDDIIRLSIGLDQGGNASLGEANGDPIHVGQLCSQEMSSGFQGYGCQINHTFFIGSASTPGHDYYRAVTAVLREIHQKVPTFIKPGKTTYDEFEQHYRQTVTDLGGQGGGVVVHSGGIGQSRPRGGEDNAMIIQPGHVFDFKPSISLKRETIKDVGERNRALQLGEAYLITDKGAQRIGTRDLGPILTQG